MNDFKVETRQPQHHLWGKAGEAGVKVAVGIPRDMRVWLRYSAFEVADWCQSTEAHVNRTDMGIAMDTES
jgi:hypothetical protein